MVLDQGASSELPLAEVLSVLAWELLAEDSSALKVPQVALVTPLSEPMAEDALSVEEYRPHWPNHSQLLEALVANLSSVGVANTLEEAQLALAAEALAVPAAWHST